MSTTMYFSEILHDERGKSDLKLEFGTISSIEGKSLYLDVDDKIIILNHASAEKILDAMARIATYLNLAEP